jgi:hypothetical protein
MLTNWLHRFLNPHCEVCELREREREEREAEARICKSCEFLRLELAKEREVSKRLLDSILTSQQVSATVSTEPVPEPISSYVPWHVRKARLEEKSRVEAMQSKQIYDESTEQLEKELLNDPG